MFSSRRIQYLIYKSHAFKKNPKKSANIGAHTSNPILLNIQAIFSFYIK